MNSEIHVGFVGPYSTANLGDYAMLVNNIYDIGAKNITIFSYSPKFPKVALDIYCENYNIKLIEPKIKGNIELSINQTNATPMEILSIVENKNELEHEIGNLDVLVVSGGGWINHFWNERKDKLFKIIAPLLIAKQRGKKIVFTANGIGPFDETKEFYRYIFSYLGDIKIAIRDDFTSLLYLSDLGIDKKEVSIIPDDLYIINNSLLSHPLNYFPKSKKYIVVESFFPMKLLESEIERIKLFARIIKERYGLNIIFLPYDLISYGLDQARYLHNNIEGSELVDIEKTGFLPVQDAFNIIKNAQFMFSSRYHGLVLSLAAKTPVIYRTLPTKGDMRYSYSKAIGLIRSAFNGTNVNEHSFLNFDLINSLETIESNLHQIIAQQNDLFEKHIFRENFDILRKKRINYISKYILSDKHVCGT